MSPTANRLRRQQERGSALILSLFIVVILAVLGLGLLLRSNVSMTSAGAERTMTKNFYAADSGIHAGFAHLALFVPCAFSFEMTDQRGAAQFPMQVSVAESRLVGISYAPGSSVGGTMSGGGTPLVYYSWRMGASAAEPASHTFREIEAEMSIGPTVLSIVQPCS